MTARGRTGRVHNIAGEIYYWIYVAARDAIKTAIWLNHRYKAKSALDRWQIRVALAHTLIGGLPGVFLGLLTAIALTANSVPAVGSPYRLYYEATFVMVWAFVAVCYYMILGCAVLSRSRERLGLEMPEEAVDQIIKSSYGKAEGQ